MNDEAQLQPWDQDELHRLRIICAELQQAAKRMRLAGLLASLPNDDAVLTYTSRHGRVTFAQGTFDIELRMGPGEQPCAG